LEEGLCFNKLHKKLTKMNRSPWWLLESQVDCKEDLAKRCRFWKNIPCGCVCSWLPKLPPELHCHPAFCWSWWVL
jgi:hypothetical protein